MTDPRRDIPRTDVLLAQPRFVAAERSLGHRLVKAAVVSAQQWARSGEIAVDAVGDEAFASLPRNASTQRGVINATGVVVHTNLGRAPLSSAAVDAIANAGRTTDVEFDLATGHRALRGRGALAALSDAVPEAGGVHIVNNNAAALLLCALVFGAGKEIIVSRGELVEIGDGFRIPDLLESAGARLREVGTTNRSGIRDYVDAIGPDTGFLLKVHPSNFRVSGFTGCVDVADLAGRGVPLVVDIGSGLLEPHPLLPDEPDATNALRAGANVVTASADKLLGGPQAGLLLGEVESVERLRRHPSARALRVDKLTLAALEATLRGPQPPVRCALETSEAQLWHRAEQIVSGLLGPGGDGDTRSGARVVQSVAMVGGGGAPGVDLPSAAVSLPVELARPLRVGDPPVIGRVASGRCLLDLRAVDPEDDFQLVEAVNRCMS